MGLNIISTGVFIATAIVSGNTWASNFISKHAYVPDEVLIVPQMTISTQNASIQAQSQGLQILQSHPGKTPFFRMKLKKGETVESMLQNLAGQPWIGHVQPNYIHQITTVPNDPDYDNYWGLNNSGQFVNGTSGTAGVDIEMQMAWDVATDCSNVTVAVIDSGVDYNHPDLTDNIWSNIDETENGADDDGNGFIDDIRGWDFVQSDNDPMDFLSHGTHVAGTIGAEGNNSIGGTGICWQVKIMPLRAADSTGSVTTADKVAAIDYATANGADIINLSLGGTGGAPGDLTDIAIANANSNGVLVVAAAGNNNSDNDATPFYPASYTQTNIISVAAIDQNNLRASFSNYGATSVDIGAPGVNIKSSVPPARTEMINEGLETGAAGWSLQTLDSAGDPAAPDTTAITAEFFASGSKSVTDSPGANYENDRSYRIISPTIDLTGQEGALLSYAFRADTEGGYDIFRAETSINGTTWTEQASGSGSTGGWLTAQHDIDTLDGAASSQVRFRLETDSDTVSDGIHIDDIVISVTNTAIGDHNGSTEYEFKHGTSMATPHVTGLAALLKAYEPSLTHLEIRARILDNGDSVAALAGNTVTGRRINALTSLQPPSPVVQSSGGGGAFGLLGLSFLLSILMLRRRYQVV